MRRGRRQGWTKGYNYGVMQRSVTSPEPFPLALEVVKMLHDDFGAVMGEYDVHPSGTVIFELGVAPCSWKFRIARHAAVVDSADRVFARNKQGLSQSRAAHGRVQAFLQERGWGRGAPECSTPGV